jgi:repressor of nif and glnA expression
VIGGLNPVAIFEERGIEIQLHALSGLMEYNRLLHYTQLERI